MARSHHRKKHKTHLRQFRHTHDTSTPSARSRARAVSVFTITGAIAGFAIGYFATQGSMLWLIAGMLIGGGAGYILGRRIDKEDNEAK